MKDFAALAILSACLISCSKDRLTASGDKSTETRTVKQFTGIESSGANDIHISYGTEFRVMLKGSDNLLPYFKTEVLGNTLRLGYERVNVKHDDVEIYVTLPALNYISLSGSGDATISGSFPQLNVLQVLISGSAELEAENSLQTDELLVKISGSGEVDLKRVQSNSAELSISGSGEAKIGACQHLKARISGSGKVYYTGTPLIDSQISGSGKLLKL
ncbi:GIN domain-containing protein [Pedobacter sp. GR22-6]|uniref:GIN domain-containing protein n=1 Tax=Pedobacter sp. GR22-6 TaxID=3127957 RepID=UPI00307D22B8